MTPWLPKKWSSNQGFWRVVCSYEPVESRGQEGMTSSQPLSIDARFKLLKNRRLKYSQNCDLRVILVSGRCLAKTGKSWAGYQVLLRFRSTRQGPGLHLSKERDTRTRGRGLI